MAEIFKKHTSERSIEEVDTIFEFLRNVPIFEAPAPNDEIDFNFDEILVNATKMATYEIYEKDQAIYHYG